jgi:hypothetical protein
MPRANLPEVSVCEPGRSPLARCFWFLKAIGNHLPLARVLDLALLEQSPCRVGLNGGELGMGVSTEQETKQ